MKRTWLTVFGGLLLALAGYLCSYYIGTANIHTLQHTKSPELGWLKEEFHLSDQEYARISKMHDAYLAGCAERCRLIDAKNSELRQLLSTNSVVTPQIEQALSEAARLRTECQKQMLQHFYDVSQTMPPEQGKRYLAWVQSQTILPDAHSQMQGGSPEAGSMHEHHH